MVRQAHHERVGRDFAIVLTFTWEDLLRLLATAVGARVRLVHTHPTVGYCMTKLVGLALRDVALNRDEVRAG